MNSFRFLLSVLVRSLICILTLSLLGHSIQAAEVIPPVESEFSASIIEEIEEFGEGILTENTHPIPANTIKLTFSWDMYVIPDMLVVTYDGDVVFATNGEVPGTGSAVIDIAPDPGEPFMVVTVISSDPGTAWEYTCIAKALSGVGSFAKEGPIEPPCIDGPTSKAQSMVDNNRRQHIHDAIDFTANNDASLLGCQACGGSSGDSAAGLAEFQLARFHRYLDVDQRSSFGPGVFSNYDSSLQLSAASGTITRIEWFDPLERVPFRFTAGGVAGTFTDPHRQAVQGVFLTTTAGVATNTLADAARATVKRWDGTRLEFEIFNVGSSANVIRMARLTGRYDRQGSGLVVSYVHPVTATDATLSYDRNRLWQISQVTDGYGRTASFTYGHHDGQWAVTSVACPGGTTLTYTYGANTLVGLNQVAYPTGDVSTFSAAYDASSQDVKLSMSDAGTSGIHRRKALYLTASTAVSTSGDMAVHVPNQIHAVKNGNDEISYLSWVESRTVPDAEGANFYSYIYEGGGAGNTGTLMRYDTNDGLPVRTLRAVSWVFGQPASTYTWEIVQSYVTGANQRLTSRTEPDGTEYDYQRDPASGAITSTTVTPPVGASYTKSTTYNAFNQPLIETDGLERKTRFVYDTAGNRLTKTAGYDSSVESHWGWTYNARGQVLTASDANLNQTDYVYEENPGNHYRRLIAVIEPADIVSGPRATRQITYDAVGRVATTTDAEGRTATFLYDLRNRVSRITYQDTSYEEWTYGSGVDANLLATHRDRNGNLDTMTYDAAGRMTGKTRSSPTATIAQTSSWTHVWGKDLPATETIDGETTTFGYDFQFRRISETRSPRAGVTLVSSRLYGSDQYVNYEQDPYGRRIYQVYNELGLAKRTVRELVPGALTVPTTSLAARNAYLNGLARIFTPNPAYVIADQAYDVEGQVIGSTDERGITSVIGYDAQGRVTATVEAATDASTVPATITPYAALTGFGYDANGNRTMVVHPRSFTRNPTTGDFTQVAVPFVTASIYTGRNLLKSVTEASGTSDAATVNYTYTLTKQKASQSDPRNAAWLTNFTYYACCNRLYQMIDALGLATTYTYDANGNVLTVRDANNTGENRIYDARNRPLTVTNTDNETTTITYDDHLADAVGLSGTYSSALATLGFTTGADGFAVEISNHLGETALEIRDGVGRVVRRVDGNGNQTTASYDGVVGGLVATSVTDALANSNTSYADGSGLIRQAIDAQSRTSTATFDASGNQLTALDPNSVGWTATYDLRNRRLTTTDTHGDATAYTYDLHGNVLTTRDALLKIQQNTYDYRDRKVTSSDRLEPVAGITSYEYDEVNNLLVITDADSVTNGVTDYSYDQRGKLETEIFPVGKDGKRTVRTYTYDNGGRLWKRTLTTTPAATPALNELTTYGYDNANRLTSRTYSDGQGNDSFTYDDAGRLQTAVSGRFGSTVTRTYTGNTPAEKAGRLTSEQLSLSGTNAGLWTVNYQYDAANRLSTLTYPTSDTSVRTYTSRHQLDTVTFAGANVATRTYDNGGRLTGTTFGNSLVETRTYRSDVNGVDNQLATQVIPGVTNFTYAYDANKRITQETNGLFSAQTQQFSSYDNENRLTGWSRGTDAQSWMLSKVGDWTSTTINGVAQPRTHSAVHEVTAIGGVPLDYDLKGNLKQNQDGALYNWDSENRLTAATVADTTYGVTDTATYRYDALGRRVQKTVYGMVTTFIHAGAQVIHEFDAKIQLPAASADDDGTGAGTPPGGGILQGEGVTRFNYQPSLSPIPSGFFADKGKVYGTRSNGKSYGWLTTARTDTVIRNQHPYPQFDTFNQAWLNNTGSAGTWEIDLANGTYAVIVVMGDPASANQTNDLTIEGQAQTDPDPAVVMPIGYLRGDYDGYAVTVTVADGRLTLAIPATADNPKLCFIEIGAQGSSITQADIDRLEAAIEDATAETGLPPFPKPQPTPRQYVYGSYVDEPLLMRAGGAKYYFVTNHLYSVAAITNQSGQVTERYKYDAYGRQTILADNGVVSYRPSDFGNFTGFTGRYHDWETGIQYSRTRYFSAELGRFLNRMPWFSAQGIRLWAWDPTVMSEEDSAGFSQMLDEDGFGAYFQDRYNLYDYALGSPGSHLEPFSRLPRRPWRKPPTPLPLPPGTGAGVRTDPPPPRRKFSPDREDPAQTFPFPEPKNIYVLCPPNPKGALPNGITTAAQERAMLQEAATQNGNFGIGVATRADSQRLGEAWVGPGARLASDGITLVSANGLRTYRPPSPKDSPFATTGVQSNFGTLVKNPNGTFTMTGNAHLDIIR